MADEEARRAFNQGADARIRGLPISTCPYSPLETDTLRRLWKDGWEHVDHYWGWENPQAFPLPTVKEIKVAF